MKTTTKAIAAAVVAGIAFGVYKIPRMIEDSETEDIIRQSATCSNKIAGEGLTRKGEFLVGRIAILVSGKHLIEVPGATRVVVGSDIQPGPDNDSVTVDAKQGEYAKIIIKIPESVQFDPRWTMPNGLKWPVPFWVLYGLGQASERRVPINPIP